MYRSRKGYVEEQMQGIALVMAKLLGLKEAGDIPTATTEIGEAFDKYCGVSLKLVVVLAQDSVRQLFAGTTEQEIARRFAAAVLLDEYGSMLRDKNQLAGANASWIRAAILLEETIKSGPEFDTEENRDRLAALMTRIS